MPAWGEGGNTLTIDIIYENQEYWIYFFKKLKVHCVYISLLLYHQKNKIRLILLCLTSVSESVKGWIPLKKTCWSPNPQDLSVWPMYRQCLYRGNQVRSFGWALIQYDRCPCKKEKFRQRHVGKVMWRDSGRRQPSTSHGERPSTDPSLTPLHPQKTNPVDTLISDF